ncbi:MAG: hypothetical protein CL607_17815 [Anaerolineaceae bacterium]|nr:hypothetical protein [Anaerolineaceae bacterium]
MATAQTGAIVLNPLDSTVTVGDTFTINVELQAGTDEIIGADVYLTFDPTLVQVNNVATAPELPSVLAQSLDNGAGTIGYSLGKLSSPYPMGTFDLLQIEFEALSAGVSPLAFSTTSVTRYLTPSLTAVTPPLTDGSITVNAPVTVCSPISTLDCASVPVSVPFSLDWDADEGSLGDIGGVGIGFTMVDPPSARLAVDDPVSNTEVPGYEPDLLAVNTANSVLTISATKGIQYRDPSLSSNTNSQINAVGVGFDADGEYVISTVLVNPAFNASSGNNSQQAGIWFGINEDNYAKLVVAKTGTTTGKVQLLVEDYVTTSGAQPEELNTGNLPGDITTQTIYLQMHIDATTGEIEGYYSTDGVTYTLVEEGGSSNLTAGAHFFTGVDHDSNVGTDPVSYAGVFTTLRRADASPTITFAFDSFSIAPVVANAAPTADAGSDQTVVDNDGNGNQDVILDGSGSSDSDGTIENYSWVEDSVEIATTANPTVNFDVGVHTVTLTVTDDEGTTATDEVIITVEAPAVTDCSPISTLDCASVPVSVPFSLDWNVDEGGLDDSTNVGIGFTMVDPPSARLAVDDPVLNTAVPGYEPSLLAVDTANSVLAISATKGIQYRDPSGSTETNSQINAVGVGFDANGDYIISTVLVNPAFNVSNGTNAQQAGLWFGINEDNYAKLVVAKTGTTSGKVQLLVEDYISNGTDQPLELNTGNVGGDITTATIYLQMHLDVTTGEIEGYYSTDGVTYTLVEEGGSSNLTAGAHFFTGVDHDSNVGTDPVSYAGLFTTLRRADASPTITFAFDSFSIEPAVANVAPIADAGSDQTVVDNDGNGNQDVILDGSGSSDSDGTIESYSWVENSVEIATTENPTVNFDVGTYTVTLTVTDDDGATASDDVIITVEAAPDTTPPVIALIGDATVNVEAGTPYTDAGASASDDVDGDLTGSIVVDNPVNTSVLGTYTVTYDVTDSSGNEAVQVTRTVIVEDTTPPVITVTPQTASITVGDEYTAPTVTANDSFEGDLTTSISEAGEIPDPDTVGTYVVTYDVSDSSGNAAVQQTFTLMVMEDSGANVTLVVNDVDGIIEYGTNFTADVVIDLFGNAQANTVQLEVTYDPAVLSVVDATTTLTNNLQLDFSTPGLINFSGGADLGTNLDTDFTALQIEFEALELAASSDIDFQTNPNPAFGTDVFFNGTSILDSTLGDSVSVVDTTAPVIQLVDDTITLALNEAYVEPGYTATDNYDGDLTSNVTTSDDIDIATVGTYTVTYDVTDSSGNEAVQVTRTVIVADTIAPVITLNGDATENVEAGTPYTDAGATATDNVDGDLTSSIVVDNPVDTGVLGTYTVTYDVTDSNGNDAVQVTRTVIVEDTTAPVITVTPETLTITEGDTYTLPTVTAEDSFDGDLTGSLNVGGQTPDNETVGTYVVTYDVADSSGNNADQKTFTLIVEEAPEEATILGNLLLQGRSDASGDVTVEFYQSGSLVTSTTASVDAAGNFSVAALPVGSFEIAVKAPTYLQVVEAVSLVDGDNIVSFGTLLAGDANDDNVISALDFSILSSSFNLLSGDPGYDARADFNGDGFITAIDFSLLSANFNVTGETPSS